MCPAYLANRSIQNDLGLPQGPAGASGPDEQILSGYLLFITLVLLTGCDRGHERSNVLTGDGQPEVTVMNFSAPVSLDPLPAGWYHRTFWTRGPMQMAYAFELKLR